VIQYAHIKGFAAMALLLAVALAACHKEEQAVVGVAHEAVNAEHQAQAAAQASASKRDQQREELARIPLPTKSLYVDVHEPGFWANPFLSVDADTLSLRVTMTDANPSSLGQGTMLRPEAARRREIQLRPADLAEALVALPPGAWRYGRVIAVAESPQANPKDRPKVRRNVEAAIQQLNDLGLVVEEWPTR
jgi:Asp-tRNA(Asn)/Glu-tRNA(Gln) amidotransferase A subunit family amidase